LVINALRLLTDNCKTADLLMEELFRMMVHADELIGDLVAQYGTLTYLILFTIVFVETGLVVVTFFPGDGLLFSAGILAASGELSLAILLILLTLATILGNTSNYLIGRFVGVRLFRKEKAKRNHYLAKAFTYYEKYGGKAVILSRFFPFMRSFVPFVAGITAMKIVDFTWCNILGGILWISTYLLLGFFFGEIPWVKANFGLVLSGMLAFLLLVILISLLKGVVQLLIKKSP